VPNPPDLVAIVNITEDSFSDGGRFLAPDAAIDHARALAAAGADWLELGPASSNPDAGHVAAETQIHRLEPVVAALKDGPLPLSVDATDPAVLEWAIEHSLPMLNDIRGFPEAATRERVADSPARLVVVHSLLEQPRATRDRVTPKEVLESIDRFFDRRLEELIAAGVSQDRLIVDPGMGFFLGSDPLASVAVLNRIPELRARFGCPVFISVSRKSFLRTLTGKAIDEAGAATLTAELHAARESADYVRTHDVGALRDGLTIEAALRGKR